MLYGKNPRIYEHVEVICQKSPNGEVLEQRLCVFPQIWASKNPRERPPAACNLRRVLAGVLSQHHQVLKGEGEGRKRSLEGAAACGGLVQDASHTMYPSCGREVEGG